MRKVSTSFFEKKEAKKLLLFGPAVEPAPQPIRKSFFFIFFQKSNYFLTVAAPWI
jgi:hypothetical protein